MLNPKAIRTISDIRFMDLKQYQRLTSLIADYHDTLRIKEALEDPDGEWVALDAMWKEHGFAKNRHSLLTSAAAAISTSKPDTGLDFPICFIAH